LVIAAAATADRTSARHVDRITATLLIKSEEHRAKIESFKAR
jgi:hypothetical protein